MADKLTVRDLWNQFHYRQITGNNEALDRPIEDANTNRPGLELSGYLQHPYKRVVIMGEKEISYIKTMCEEKQREVFNFLTNEDIPMILISRDLPCPEILKNIAIERNFPIFTSYAPTNSLIVEIVSYLEEFFAPRESVHGVLMQVYGKGVLLRGDSGVGKSEIALELIRKGHILVSDDRVDLYRYHNKITGEASEILKNMLEIRGVGIIDVTRMFGVASAMEKCVIDYVIDLKKLTGNEELDRSGLTQLEPATYFGVDVPRTIIPVSEGRSVAVIIEAAVNNMILIDQGFNSADELDARIIALINKQKEGMK